MKDKMLTEVIRKYGFEHKITLMFARLCENGTSMARLTTIYKIIMKKQKGGKPFFYWLRAHGQGAQCFALFRGSAVFARINYWKNFFKKFPKTPCNRCPGVLL